uniref:NADH-ubiquinone oxidoreductase chain 6 n=1 Tax=Albinaria caerulea TaxID=42349 RepID=NU6M_ALBCA|nr:NADH dehydrogenase subunit 6 [Albinaria caerulea]P48922.1 RecName: Full=NADH-ubiquinone oxidoreductase chain 6; AltName: Full=NADH dehydrogenase subunit 6 [Albinaria caerulea]CAA58308.1 ND6 [Albinaria caerulea]
MMSLTFMAGLIFPVFMMLKGINPMSLLLALLTLSLCAVLWLGSFMSSWYAYILFIVYIGGILVLFIYVCMISSNYIASQHMYKSLLYAWGAVMLMSLTMETDTFIILGSNMMYTSVNIPMTILIFLSIYLLIVFFAVVNLMVNMTSILMVESSQV